MLNTSPIRAANIFGPALIRIGFKENIPVIFRDKKANGLYRENSPDRSAKSTNRKTIGKTLPVRINMVRNKIVNAPLRRAICSSIFLFDMGQKAVVFILHFFIILYYKVID